MAVKTRLILYFGNHFTFANLKNLLVHWNYPDQSFASYRMVLQTDGGVTCTTMKILPQLYSEFFQTE